MSGPRERAARLLRCYPRAWRARYGEEFTELLIADLAQRPRSPARTADVVRGGIVARLTEAGLCGFAPEGTERTGRRARASLASLACCAAVFLGFGAAMWSQLAIGWQWSAPDTAAAVATVVMSGAMLVLAVLALLAALPVAGAVAARIARGRARDLFGPSVLFLAGLTVMVVGGRHFGNGWPGTGGHPWTQPGPVPGGVAAFSWASTLSVSSFWAHPAALAAFPAAELTWMALSPLALGCLVTGAAAVVRRTELSGGAGLRRGGRRRTGLPRRPAGPDPAGRGRRRVLGAGTAAGVRAARPVGRRHVLLRGPAAGRSGTRSPTRPATAAATSCRWWSCCTATGAATPTPWPGCRPRRRWR